MKKLLLTICMFPLFLKADLTEDIKIHCEDRFIEHAFLLEDLKQVIDMNAYSYILGKQAAYMEIMHMIGEHHNTNDYKD